MSEEKHTHVHVLEDGTVIEHSHDHAHGHHHDPPGIVEEAYRPLSAKAAARSDTWSRSSGW